jgi:citrate lyase beta subunit
MPNDTHINRPNHEQAYRLRNHSDNRHLQLGASLYVPGNHDSLIAIANGEKYPMLRSVIFCTEDSVRAEDIPFVLRNIENALIGMTDEADILRFIRVRSPEVLSQCLQMSCINKIDGFVLPKVTCQNLESYMNQLKREDHFEIMITLETPEAFDQGEMTLLRSMLMVPRNHKRILSIRIGGNDLLNHIGMRRSREHTLYDTPLSHTISMLVNVFKPYGFNLTAPVCDYMNADDLLRRECDLDLSHGLFGKTAIHPEQIAVIEEQYRVSKIDIEMAEAILDPNRPAVFRMHDAMCESATHGNWAEHIIARANIYGVISE